MVALWAEAEEAWLAAKGANSRHTRRAYATALRLFKEYCQETRGDARMWMVAGAEITGWQQSMLDDGLARATVNQRIAAISSFFDYVCNHYPLPNPRSGRDVYLRETNPAKRVERVKTAPYEEAEALSVDEVRALIGSIPLKTVYDYRDKALIVTYLYTGRRSSEVRKLRWGDISHDRGRVYYRWSGKGRKARTDELPLPAYSAIVDYLDAAELLGSIQDDDFIFTALSDVATRLPNVDQVPENKPLGGDFINRIVKKRARLAGLQWEKIHTHSLRHTHSMIRIELTGDIKDLQDQLGHSTSATTDRYVRVMRRKEDTVWTRIEELIGVE